MTPDSTATVWVGMDVHQESITAAILFGDKDIPEVVRLPGDLNAVRRLFRRLTKQGTPRACNESLVALATTARPIAWMPCGWRACIAVAICER